MIHFDDNGRIAGGAYNCECSAGKGVDTKTLMNGGNGSSNNSSLSSILSSSSPASSHKYLTSSSSSVDPMMAPCPSRNSRSRYFPFNKRRIKKSTWRTVGISVFGSLILIFLQLQNGLIEKCFLEKDFRFGFEYPLDVKDFPGMVKRFIEAENQGIGPLFQPSPVNLMSSSVSFLQSAEDSISNGSAVGLLIVVKSAPKNYEKRMAIRKTWGDLHYLQDHFLSPELPTKVAFICGFSKDVGENEAFLGEEVFGDMILAQFQDSYGNNTYKTLLIMRWATEHVKNFKYLMIADDDMYISPPNAILFLQGNIEVQNVISQYSGASALYPVSQIQNGSNSILTDGNIPGEIVPLKGRPLIMGQVWADAAPFRNVFGTGSKWSTSIDEYPYSYFPPYVAGGATLIDAATVANLYYASLFTKSFWIDDVYIGIIAKKLGIILTHSDLIDSTYRNPKNDLKHDITDMIAFHGLECPEQLVEIWQTMNLESLSDCSKHTSLW